MKEKLRTMTCDGNTATAYVAYAYSELAGIYPITPSSPMADAMDQWATQGRKNIFGQKVDVIEMQSEGGAAGLVHGALSVGALTTTFTSSQGLLLMLPNMYKIAGELQPCVFHVAARTLATHALSIFCDHSDVMACRQSGFAILASSSVQETVWMSMVAHLATLKSKVPFMHFFDGFRTSHEIQKIQVPTYEAMASYVDQEALKRFRKEALSPNQPRLKGTAQNPDVFFQNREASNVYYNQVPQMVEECMEAIAPLTKEKYGLYEYYGSPEATEVLVCMGSACETIKETVDFLLARGEKVGLVQVRLYRPFAIEKFLEVFPKTVKNIAVLDRTKEPGALGEPLYLDVVAAFAMQKKLQVSIYGGRYGLSSKETTPSHIASVFYHLKEEKLHHPFSVGIYDDVTHLSLPVLEKIDCAGKETLACRFWGLGSDGTVSANKNTIKMVGAKTDLEVQAYFSYDSKKSGGITVSDLRFSKEKIRSTYRVDAADFISCSQQSYVYKYDLLEPLKEGGIFLLNTSWGEKELELFLPPKMKKTLAKKKIQFYVLPTQKIDEEHQLQNKINLLMQSAFFSLTRLLPMEQALLGMKERALKSYGKKGADIIALNEKAIELGYKHLRKIEIPSAWEEVEEKESIQKEVPLFVEQMAEIIHQEKGDSLPVSRFASYVDGGIPLGTSQYEKRGIALEIPVWDEQSCVQCNQCAYVCPHAAIRPFLLTDEEVEQAPQAFPVKQGSAPYKQYKFRIQVSSMDCTGCGDCVEVCPSKPKSLIMKKAVDALMQEEAKNYAYLAALPSKSNPMKTNQVKGSQFQKPYLEFSGACAGCGETPYAKLVTQLFGDRMLIANATGCSSIWGASYPSTPYTVNEKGRGPAWANSLFEDNAEYGLGMFLGAKHLRNRLRQEIQALLDKNQNATLEQAFSSWITDYEKTEETVEKAESLIEALRQLPTKDAEEKDLLEKILENKDFLSKRSQWIFGGDGWAYDIGFGGLDHVLSTGENVNVLVFDTELYSNTGGQSSKATPTASLAQFASSGKAKKKKDLGMMAMNYGYVYVAQIGMGANQAQTLKAILEAEAYDGPSLIIAYAPCIAHGVKGGLRFSQEREQKAVECGYWHLYRYDPSRKAKGQNPFQLDSKPPKYELFFEFLMNEARYHALQKQLSEEQFLESQARALADAKERYLSYVFKEKEDAFLKEQSSL